jgi:superfamily II DNA or RNA helicase
MTADDVTDAASGSDSDADAAGSDDACSIESADRDCSDGEQEEEEWDDDSSSDGGSIDEESDYAELRVLARSIARTRAGRVLSFHSRAKFVDDCVRAFATPENQQLLVQQLQEFGVDGQQVRLDGVTAEDRRRQELLQAFDATPDDEVFVLASCRTIGEGVDTKNANMVFFAAPRGSHSATLQVRWVLHDLFGL